MSAAKRQAEKHRMILEAARKVFLKKGFHSAKVDEIAQEAEVGKGTVYEYFSNKESLFLETIQSLIESHFSQLTMELMKEAPALDKIAHMYMRHYLAISDKAELKEIFDNEFVKISKELQTWIWKRISVFVDTLEIVVQQGIAAKEIREINSRMAAYLILSGLEVCPIYYKERGTGKIEKREMQQAVDNQMDILRGGLSS